MELQVQDLIGSQRWAHNYTRATYRNGYYFRKGVLTYFGHLINLRIPRVRNGGIKFKVIDKYKRRTKDIDNMILNMFLSGVSTRRVAEVLEPLYGKGVVSAGLVSKVSKVLNEHVEKFHRRVLADK